LGFPDCQRSSDWGGRWNSGFGRYRHKRGGTCWWQWAWNWM